MQCIKLPDSADEATSNVTYHNITTIALESATLTVPAGTSITISRNTATIQTGDTKTDLTAYASAKASIGGLEVSAGEEEMERLAEKEDTPKQMCL
jgi:hypothetical protein